SLANEADASLAKHKALELEIERLLKAFTSREEKKVPNSVRASNRTKPITVSQPPVFIKKDVNSNLNGLSSTGVDNTKTKRPQPRSNTKNDRVPSASKSSRSKKKEAKVEEHHRILLLSKNNKNISSACNNIKIDSQDVISKVVCAMCKKCLISVNHDECLRNYMNGKNSRGTPERLATPKPRKPRFLLRWLPTDRLFDQEGKLVASSESESQSDCSNGDNACTSNAIEPKIKRQFCDSNLEVVFRRNACFVKNLEGVNLLKGDRSTNLYTINLHEMASASPICLMAQASSTKSWLWHQRLSHLNFDTINDLAKYDLVTGLPKFKYHKEHLCPSCEQGKSKRASHPPKLVPNSRQRLHLLHKDLCGPMRIASINGKRYVLVIVDDYSRYTWVHFLRSKDEAPEVIITFLKRITVLLQKPDISFLHVFGALCYPKNDREDIGKLGAKADIGFFIGYSADSCAYRIYNQRTKKIIETMNVSFDELSDVDELNSNAMVDGNTFVNPFANSSTSAAASSSSQNVDPSNMHTFYQPYPHEFQWTKDDPLERVTGEPSRPVFIRNRL
nr:integrase, catalytic region, zinc finger, CCHC-type, peptidase aspartic, catalytic [Tanacetum cinerariifolium]